MSETLQLRANIGLELKKSAKPAVDPEIALAVGREMLRGALEAEIPKLIRRHLANSDTKMSEITLRIS